MRQYRIQGGQRLLGEVKIGGAKNAVLPILAAVCLNQGETIITNCPRISDTFDSIEILKSIGFRVAFTENTLKITAGDGIKHEIPDEYAIKMRSSILFLGALLATTGRASLALPGGCKLGDRAINLHIEGLQAMGAEIIQQNDKLYCKTDGLKGTKIALDFPSVGATENLMIAAVNARGETTIKNAAREPEVQDLARFLKALGAKIQGAGTKTIKILGQNATTTKVTHKIIPDRIVAGTYLVAAAMTKGEITLQNVDPFDLTPVTSYLKEMGCTLHANPSTVTITAPTLLKPIPFLATKVHPGFPTDMQAQFAAALTIADGNSQLTESVFNCRTSHVKELRKMGAKITLTADKCTFLIEGRPKLNPATLAAHDLRCGAALILAALATPGESLVQNANYVQRGYESIESDLTQLGATITLEKI
ncbi:MAG: UDP-N-acetylglucosamine 1-carboxyvinyltransferase [Defluviitaleaceae bacterium]|nr:UDP-N-acetylglucosamine 1-carboxyvinyltransferase [Defluviitaleaceae bacterium]